ncbi:MAG: hypothetical protein ABIP63_04695 [Thermoanaerobaculia bacterium]
METSTASPSKARATALVVVVVAFVAGLLVGVAGDHAYLLHRRQLSPRRGMEGMTERLLDRLDHELALTPQQRDQVHRIVETHHRKIEALTGGVRPQIRQELEQANREIEAVLNPEQRVKYKAIRMKIHGGPHLHPPGGHRPF